MKASWWERLPEGETESCSDEWGHAHKYLIQFKDLIKLGLKSNPIPARDTGRAETYLVCTRTQEKGAVTPQETDPDLPMSVQESLVEAWVSRGLLQGWGQ